MIQDLIDFLWVVTLTYPLVFLLFGAAYGREYLSKGLDSKEKDECKGQKDDFDKQMEEFDKQENIAYILAGFAIAALSVIVGFSGSTIANSEPLTDFLSIGFLSEIFAGFLSHYRFSLGYRYFGFVAQYTGMLGIISGFFAFFAQSAPNSMSLFLIYAVGLLSFLLLTFPELRFYLKYWKALSDVEKGRVDKANR